MPEVRLSAAITPPAAAPPMMTGTQAVSCVLSASAKTLLANKLRIGNLVEILMEYPYANG